MSKKERKIKSDLSGYQQVKHDKNIQANLNVAEFFKKQEQKNIKDNHPTYKKDKLDSEDFKEAVEANQGVREERLEPMDDDIDYKNLETFNAVAEAEEVGLMLMKARKKLKKTQVAIADSMGTKHPAIRRIEKGLQSPSIDTVQRYANALGLTAHITLSYPENE